MAKLKKPKIKKILQDTGISQSDFITGNDTIKLVGKAPPKAKIIIYIDGKKVGVAKANKKGVWKFKTDELADGDYNVKVKAKKGKATKKSKDKTVVIDTDTDAPVITGIKDDTGTPGDLLTRDTTLTLTGTAEAGARVEITDGAKSLGSVIASAAGMWSFATAVLAQGAHSFSAEATDVAGNARSSSALAVKIDSTPPAAPSKPDLNAESDTGSLDSDNITNDTTPTFSGTVEAGSTVRLYADGVEVGSVVAGGGGAWSISASTLADGTYDITARAKDAAGNQGPASSALSVTVDTMPPSASITLNPITADSVVNAAEAGGTVAVTGTVGGDIVDGDTVTLTINGNDYTGPVTSGAFTIDVPGGDLAADGDMTVDATVTTTDDGGNPATGLDSQVYAVDTAPPAAPSVPDLEAASDTGSSNSDNITGDTTPIFSGTAEAGSTVRLYADGVEVGSVVAGGGGAWSITASTLADGTYDITARATDAAGNESAASAVLTVTVDTTPPAAPSTPDLADGSDMGASNADDITSNDTPMFTGTAEAGSTVTLYADGDAVGIDTADGSGNWSITASVLADNIYDITATATDDAGNESDASDALTITVDTMEPSVSILGFSEVTGTTGDGRTTDDDITLVGTTDANATVEVFDSGTSLGTTLADGFGDWSFDTGALTIGAHSFTAAATDAAGNLGTESAPLAVTVEESVVFDLSFLGSAQGLLIQGDAVGDRAGSGVSSAGDVNGDGLEDLIIGAPWGGDGGTPAAGEAYVVFGSSAGFGAMVDGQEIVDLTTLSPAGGFVIQGDDAGDRVGRSVSSAGDINGDGFDDLIVGAFGGDDNGAAAGEAYVVFGSALGFGTYDPLTQRQVVDLTTLTPNQGLVIRGEEAGDRAGWSVSSAGDVNGDGIDDLLVGAPGYVLDYSYPGQAYVIYGSTTPIGTELAGRQVIELAGLSELEGALIEATLGGEAGTSVSQAGDVNGDGFDDIIVGARYGYGDGLVLSGAAYVIFGSASGIGNEDGGQSVLDTNTISPADGFVIQGEANKDEVGWSVSSAGDVNGDGIDDLIIGARKGDDGGAQAGEAYVIFGSTLGFGTEVGGRQVVDLATLSSGQGFVIQGDASADFAGWSVSSAGDINGDGLADLIVGAPYNDSGGDASGEAYVVFGMQSGFGTVDGTGRAVVDVSALASTAGFSIQGSGASDQAGYSVSSAGDVNGDGFDDLVVGARFGEGSTSGAAYVLYGGAFGGSTTPVMTNGDGDAQMLIGGAGDDQLSGGGGADVIRSGAGDDLLVVSDLTFLKVDGGTGTDTLGLDGTGLTLDLTDRQVAAKINSIEKIDLTNAGNTLVVDKLAVLNETPASGGGLHVLTVAGDPGDTVEFTEAQWAMVGTVVDGATTYDRYAFGNAEVRVEEGVTVSFPSVFDLTYLGMTRGFIIQGDVAGDVAGISVSSAGDVNGDGFDDMIVGALNGDDGGTAAGEAYVVFGSGSGFGADVGGRRVIDLTTLSPGEGFIIQGDAAYDLSGCGVSSAGDVNGDGFDDLIVGAFGGDDGGTAAGEAYVVFGSGSGFGSDVGGRQVVDLTTLSPGEGFIIQGDVAYDEVGHALSSAGDVNGDGFDDLIVGVPRGNGGGGSAGEAYVIFGSGSDFGSDVAGRQVIDLTAFSSGEGFIIQGDMAGDVAGYSVSSAGDVNGDGLDDLIVGAVGGDDGGSISGEAYLVFGSGSGFGNDVGGRQVIDLTTLSPGEGFIVQGDAAEDRAGWSVSSAGDVNGDGLDDLIIGARSGDDGGADAGEAYVVFGSGSGFGSDVGGRQVIDLTTLSTSQGFIIQGDMGGDSLGRSVSSAGDVNGDGFDDLIVGAPFSANGGSNAGESYVVFGSGSGLGSDVGGRQVIDLSTLSPGEGFIIQGDVADDRLGYSVSSAGDVNGDGFDDLIVGARHGDDGGSNAGEAYVLYGAAFGGSTTPVVTNGTAAQEILIGGPGDDQLSSGGGADVIRSGAGDDTISVSDLTFFKIDGGSGTDTLVFAGTAETIDFATIANNKINGIEALDISGTGNDTIVLGALDALHFSDTPNAAFTGADSHKNLVITGDAGDTLDLNDFDPDGGGPVSGYAWSLVASDQMLDGSGSGDFDVYNLVRDAEVVASVAVASDMAVLLDP